jgi:hypothetical protein
MAQRLSPTHSQTVQRPRNGSKVLNPVEGRSQQRRRGHGRSGAGAAIAPDCNRFAGQRPSNATMTGAADGTGDAVSMVANRVLGNGRVGSGQNINVVQEERGYPRLWLAREFEPFRLMTGPFLFRWDPLHVEDEA